MFPDLVPENVQWITSQLVFDEATGILDPDATAAFGLWVADPYQSDAARLGAVLFGNGKAGGQSDAHFRFVFSFLV